VRTVPPSGTTGDISSSSTAVQASPAAPLVRVAGAGDQPQQLRQAQNQLADAAARYNASIAPAAASVISGVAELVVAAADIAMQSAGKAASAAAGAAYSGVEAATGAAAEAVGYTATKAAMALGMPPVLLQPGEREAAIAAEAGRPAGGNTAAAAAAGAAGRGVGSTSSSSGTPLQPPSPTSSSTSARSARSLDLALEPMPRDLTPEDVESASPRRSRANSSFGLPAVAEAGSEEEQYSASMGATGSGSLGLQGTSSDEVAPVTGG
jgi:hypothetical protein